MTQAATYLRSRFGRKALFPSEKNSLNNHTKVISVVSAAARVPASCGTIMS